MKVGSVKFVIYFNGRYICHFMFNANFQSYTSYTIRVNRNRVFIPSRHFLAGLAGTPSPWHLSIMLGYCYVCILINILPQRSLSLQKTERIFFACFLLQTSCIKFMLPQSSMIDSVCSQVHLSILFLYLLYSSTPIYTLSISTVLKYTYLYSIYIYCTQVHLSILYLYLL